MTVGEQARGGRQPGVPPPAPVTATATAPRTDRPSAPPIWREVLTRPATTPASGAGLSFLPHTAGVIAGSKVAPRLMKRFGTRTMVAVGGVAAAAGFGWQGFVLAPQGTFVAAVLGPGIGLLMTPLTDEATTGAGAWPAVRAVLDTAVAGGQLWGPRVAGLRGRPHRVPRWRPLTDTECADRLWQASCELAGVDPADGPR